MTNCLPYLLALNLCAAPPEARDTLQTIEGVRGGRHWVDAQTAPPKSPADSAKCFQVELGLKVELIASEPLVLDPVAIAFDHLGRMFVVEYADYPTGSPDGKPLSRVVLLEDRNGDGKMDSRSVFADGLKFAHSLMALQDGILVGAQTEIVFLQDTDGDKQADRRETWFQGFQPAHPQMQIGCPRWGLDNWIYLNYGPGKITCTQKESPPLAMPRLDFRFHPLSFEFEPDSGLGQYGNTIDRWGNRFFCTNRNPIMTTMLPYAVARRNPFAVISKAYTDVGASGGATRVYPLVAMKSNYLSHAGTHTSACGTTAYLGDLLGPKYASSVLVCEPIGHLVTHSIVKPQASGLTATRARPKADLLASTDTWFRPASLANGPDGALYVADMYRLWVEHPKFLPEDVAKRLDWRAGEDRGRIWRISSVGSKPRSFQPPKTDSDLVALLSDANAWRQYLGQRLIVERQRQSTVPALKQLLSDGNDLARLHALWTLDGLGALDSKSLLQGLADRDKHVVRDAVKLAGRRLSSEPDLLDAIAKVVAQNPDESVQLQCAVALGESADVRATSLLTQLAAVRGEDSWIRSAILTSVKERAGAVLSGIVRDKDFVKSGSPGRIALLRQLATVVGARGDKQELVEVIEAVGSADQAGVWWQTAGLVGLAAGLPRHQGALGRTSLPKLVANPPQELQASIARVRALLSQIQQIARNSDLKVSDRVVAVQLLAYRPFAETQDVFRELLGSVQPLDVQLAAVDALGATGAANAATIVLDRWATLGPQIRGPALALLMRRTDTTRNALRAMSAGKVNPAVVGLDQRVRLLKHSDKEIRSLSTKVFGSAVSSNRRAVAEEYSESIDMSGSIPAGAKVFQRVCIQCHKMDGKGHEVGPDISDVRNRARDALLYDILDPNRKVEPRFTGYTVVTNDGRIFNGLMVSETSDAVVLRYAEGKQHIIPRAEIDVLRASGKSLMPEGVEKDVTVRQMADLLEYLKSRE